MIIAAVIVSWIGTGPAAAAGSPLLIMILWFVILAIAIGTVLLSWKMRGLDHLMKTAVRTALAGSIIAVLGLAAAFISGDKFDAIRAAIISTVLMIINYSRRRNWERDGVMNLRGMNE